MIPVLGGDTMTDDDERRFEAMAAQVLALTVMVEFLTADLIKRVPPDLRPDLADQLVAMGHQWSTQGLTPGNDQAAINLGDSIVSMREKLSSLVQRALERAG